MRSRAPLLGLLLALALPAPPIGAAPPEPDWHWPPQARRQRCLLAAGEVLKRLSLALQLRLAAGRGGARGMAPHATLLLASARRLAGSWMARCPEEPLLPYLRAQGQRLATGPLPLPTRPQVEADLRRVRRLAPRFHPDRVAFELGILASLRGDNEVAAEEFARALPWARPAGVRPAPVRTLPEAVADLLFEPVGAGLVRYNLADSLVSLAGRTEEALAGFRRAAAELWQDGRVATARLARWGEALALHRLGRRAEAVALVLELQPPAAAPGPPADEGVFFSPESEAIHYRALGWLGAALDPRRDRAARCEAAEAAHRAFARYLRQVEREGGRPPWRPLVRDELPRLETLRRRLRCP